MLEKIMIVGILSCIFCVIFYQYYKKQKKQKLDKRFSEFEQIYSEIIATIADCQEAHDEFLGNESDIKLALSGDDKVKGIIELTATLTEEQQEYFQLKEYLEEGFEEKVFAEGKRVLKTIDDVQKSIGIYAETTRGIRQSQKNEEIVTKKVDEACKLAVQELADLKKICEKLKGQNKQLENTIKQIGKTAGWLEEMLQSKIICDLSLDNISELPNIMGRMSCRNSTGEFRQGFYMLDDVTILERGKLGQNIGKSHIYVYGYEDESGTVGLELKSNEAFTCKLVQESSEPSPTKQAVLSRGNRYNLTYHSDLQIVHMTLNVK